MRTTKREPSFIKGTILIIAAFFFMSLQGVISKYVSFSQDLLWVNFLTYLFSFIYLIPIVAYYGFATVKTKVFPLHFLRAFLGISSTLFYLIAITKIPLANATLLFNTSPFFIPLISLALFGYRLSKTSWFAIFVGFIGVALIIRPNSSILYEPGNLYGLASGILLALVFVIISFLVRTESVLTILFYFTGIGALLQLPFVIYDIGNMPPFHYLLVIAVIAAVFLIFQFGLAASYLYAPPAEIGVFIYVTILFVGLFDWVIWNQVPTYLDLIGALIIIVSGIITMKQGLYRT